MKSGLTWGLTGAGEEGRAGCERSEFQVQAATGRLRKGVTTLKV